jgi:hypothetical protein
MREVAAEDYCPERPSRDRMEVVQAR